MYRNFNLTDEERKQILEHHKSHGYRKPLNEQNFGPTSDDKEYGDPSDPEKVFNNPLKITIGNKLFNLRSMSSGSIGCSFVVYERGQNNGTCVLFNCKEKTISHREGWPMLSDYTISDNAKSLLSKNCGCDQYVQNKQMSPDSTEAV